MTLEEKDYRIPAPACAMPRAIDALVWQRAKHLLIELTYVKLSPQHYAVLELKEAVERWEVLTPQRPLPTA